MDAKSVGASIARLRKRCGMTQTQLAARLSISDKTISRWESGLGYPEVTIFPNLAAVLGVTVDYIMTGERKGILVAGSIITDIVKMVDNYPEKGMLANIIEMKQAVGGCAPNTAIDLAKLDPALPVAVSGRVGDDEHGRFVVSQMMHHGVNCERVLVSSAQPTSFSDVISLSSGERTFLCAKGASAEFAPSDVDFSGLNCAILHIGYILLLDEFDKPDSKYGTVMARFLHDVQQKGIKTSIDVVSQTDADYRAKVAPALKYCNYAVMNEIESGMVSGLEPYDADGSINVENIRKTMEYMAECGVKDKVIIHCREMGFCLDVPTGAFTVVPSLNIPNRLIKGNVGAGDAFCAGSLYGIYHNYDDKHLLEFASAAAACSLFAENSTDGMLNRVEVEKLCSKYKRKSI